MYSFDEIKNVDSEVADAIQGEMNRQNSHIELIASENWVSKAVMAAMGSPLTNKYAEGYPGRRYYGGCQCIDIVENLARDRAKELFGCEYANVQPHSGAQANLAVFFAMLEPGDKVLGMNLDHGGHLTHGSPVNISGKYFQIVSYGVNDQGVIDYDEVRKIALRERPRLIIAGASAYARIIDFKKFREIADEAGAYLMVDMAHIAGLVAAGLHPSPIPYADVTTTTTHKTLRGPRGGMILCNQTAADKFNFNKALFPGIQGGPLEHVIAAKAVCLKEALQPEFKEYQQQILKNAKALSEGLMKRDVKIVSGGTDNHLMLVDLSGLDVTGKELEKRLDDAGAYLMVDMAHIAGLVAAGLHPSPIPYADVTTTTTHKTLRGPRGGMILCNQTAADKFNFNKALFPGIQGGPLEHVIAAKAVCLKEALQPEFKEYQQQILKNAKALSEGLMKRDVKIVSGGTDNHLMLVDLSGLDVTGKELEKRLDDAHITCNKNTIPNDPRSPFVTSGVRLGTPAVTSRGMNEEDMDLIAEGIALVIQSETNVEKVRGMVEELTKKYPLCQ